MVKSHSAPRHVSEDGSAKANHPSHLPQGSSRPNGLADQRGHRRHFAVVLFALLASTGTAMAVAPTPYGVAPERRAQPGDIPDATEPPSYSPIGFARRHYRFYAAYAIKDIGALRQFVNPELRRALNASPRLPFEIALVLPNVYLMLNGMADGRIEVTALTTLQLEGAVLVCHMTAWRWLKPFGDEPENWFLVVEGIVLNLPSCEVGPWRTNPGQ